MTKRVRPQDHQASEKILRWKAEPIQYVREVFRAEPDAWQADGLMAIAKEPRVGFSACVGPGKTTELAWAGWWWLDTRYDAQAIAASVTRENLRDNLWKELASWYGRAPQLQRAFDLTAERIAHKERPRTWWLSARGWAKDADASAQASALGGFHARHVLVLLDEAGTLPDAVMVTAERIFANAEIDEAKIVAAWNPERTDGAAYRICTQDRHRWAVINITGDPEDPKRSPRISLKYARDEIEKWGRDADWVRVNVLGLFPLRGMDTLLGPDDVVTAQGRDFHERALRSEASVWGLDPARSPEGDRAVLRERCGPVAFRPFVWRGLDGPALASRCSSILHAAKRRPDYLVVDVGGVGASAYDHLKILGWESIIVPIDFAGVADKPDRFLDKNAEMHWRLAQWVRKTGCLPLECGELTSELTTRKFKYQVRGKRTGYGVESKDDLKARGLPSPDEADALALTFAQEVWPKREWVQEVEFDRRPAAQQQGRRAKPWQEAMR